MPRQSSQLCPKYQAAMEILGKRWTGVVLQVLLQGPLRFNELMARLEVVSDRMLSERLKELETAGIVHRNVVPDQPVRVEYALTEKGLELEAVVSAVGQWAEKWMGPARGSDRRNAQKRR